MEDVDETLYFLKELLLLDREWLSGSVRELLFRKVIDKIFIDGFSQNDEDEAFWAIIIIGKLVDILQDGIITTGIYDRFFGNHCFSSEKISKVIKSKKWVTYLQNFEGINFLLSYAYIFYLAYLHKVFSETLFLDVVKDTLEIFIKSAFCRNDTPTVVFMVCLKMSLIFKIQDFSPMSVI